MCSRSANCDRSQNAVPDNPRPMYSCVQLQYRIERPVVECVLVDRCHCPVDFVRLILGASPSSRLPCRVRRVRGCSDVTAGYYCPGCGRRSAGDRGPTTTAPLKVWSLIYIVVLLMSVSVPPSTAVSLPPDNVADGGDDDDSSRAVVELSSSIETREVPVDCQPVPHDTLWLRLRLVPRGDPTQDVDDGRRLIRTRRRTDDLAVLDDVDNNSPPTSLPDASAGVRQLHRLRHSRRRKKIRKSRRRSNRTTRKPRPGKRRDGNNNDNNSDHPPWHCHMEPVWQQLPDTFPEYLETGRCRRRPCYGGHYECRPRYYTTRVLKRLPGRCNPVPVIGDDDDRQRFEEAWTVEDVKVVVGCECTRKRAGGTYELTMTGRTDDNNR